MTSIFIFIMPHFSTQKFMKDRVENLYFMLYHWYVLRNFSKNNLINFSIQILAIKIRITIIIVYFQNIILAYTKYELTCAFFNVVLMRVWRAAYQLIMQQNFSSLPAYLFYLVNIMKNHAKLIVGYSPSIRVMNKLHNTEKYASRFY